MERGAHPGRRSLLLGAAVAGTGALLGGCTGKQTRTPTRRTVTTGPAPSPRDQDDVSLVVAAIVDEERLRGYCTEISRRHRSTRETVRPLASRQQAHVEALRDLLTETPPHPTTEPPPVPSDPKKAVRVLRSRLESARERRLADCLAASSGRLARVLASVAASHACSLAEVETSG